ALSEGRLTRYPTQPLFGVFGFGMIDAAKAVAAAVELANAASQPPPPPALAGFPNEVHTAAYNPQLVLIYNAGSGHIAVKEVKIAPPSQWLTVAPYPVDADGLGTYAVTLNPQALPPDVGTGVATIEFDSDLPDTSPFLFSARLANT